MKVILAAIIVFVIAAAIFSGLTYAMVQDIGWGGAAQVYGFCIAVVGGFVVLCWALRELTRWWDAQ